MAATARDESAGYRALERIALGVVGLGCLSLVWFHRVTVDTNLVPAIIDEYWVAVCVRWIRDGLLPYRDFFQFHFPGSYELYAAVGSWLGIDLTVLRAVHGAAAVLLGATLAAWFRRRGRGWAGSIGVAVLVAGPCLYLWPVLTPHLPGMLALAAGSVLLFRRGDGPGVPASSLAAGGLLFFAGWCVQTLAVLSAATLAGALVFGVEGVRRRRWAPWAFAGSVVPAATWVASLVASGQWPDFLRQAVAFVVADGYKQAGGINDVNPLAAIAGRIAGESGPGKLVVAGAVAACAVVLVAAAIAGVAERRSACRALIVPAAIAPLVYLAGRTDAAHAFYLCVPGLLLLGSPRWDGRGGRLARRAGLAGVAGLSFAFFLATMPHLTAALRAGTRIGDPHPPAVEAVAALARLGVAPDDPVAVVPWAANLYYHGVVPGHRFPFVAPLAAGYQGEREWSVLRSQIRASGARWLAFYPATRAGEFLVDGRPAPSLVPDGTVAIRVGQAGAVELWRLEPEDP